VHVNSIELPKKKTDRGDTGTCVNSWFNFSPVQYSRYLIMKSPHDDLEESKTLGYHLFNQHYQYNIDVIGSCTCLFALVSLLLV